MNRQIYAIRDTLSGQYLGGLQLFPADAPAVRFFSDIAIDPQTMIARHPQDHELVSLGYLDDDGIIVASEKPIVVITGAAWKAAQTPSEDLTK